ncbi:cobalamin biosynthesis protein CbiX [Embleya sp. NBC_00896]|uniref:sirohydrochlorin chelatase n=1 Tax=Embleya sp. NBC_00896 TaxID=2975961 RepID=UPI002F918750|nr:cobalamin biosynthesis protein CbiX [Embleya sp. NBC_00896]
MLGEVAVGGIAVGEVAVVAVGGHESANGAALPGLLGPGVTSVACGRQLQRAVTALSRSGAGRVCVVPMTLGRDGELAAHTARTLLALPAAERARVVLTEGFGTARHLTGWLRAAAARVPAEAALLVTAPAGDPYDDAELYRIARLVWQYGQHRIVEVALVGGDPDLDHGLARCRVLGAARTVALPASFVLPPVPGVTPLLSAPAAAGVLAARIGTALERLRTHGDDGLATGLTAADEHGTAHSHADGHPHGRSHGHGHSRSHGHAPAQVHAPAPAPTPSPAAAPAPAPSPSPVS